MGRTSRLFSEILDDVVDQLHHVVGGELGVAARRGFPAELDWSARISCCNSYPAECLCRPYLISQVKVAFFELMPALPECSTAAQHHAEIFSVHRH
jgi:hypothetical protein